MTIDFKNYKPSDTQLMIIPVYEGCEMGPKTKKLDLQLGNILDKRMRAKTKFNADPGQSLHLSVDPVHGMQDIVLLGMGKPENVTQDSVRKLSGAIGNAIKSVDADKVSFLSDFVDGCSLGDSALAVHLMDAYAASTYAFTKYKTKPTSAGGANDNENEPRVTAIVNNVNFAELSYAPLKAVTDSANWARDLGNEPPNKLTPVAYAKRIEEEFHGLPNVKVKTLDESDMKALGMGGILAVTQGSTMNPARISIIEYDGTNGSNDRPLALVGKGVTFDTGGNNLKPGGSMANMKTDMCGSAAVVGTMRALATTQAQTKTVAIVGLTENMMDGDAYRPSDIITMMNGKTVEIGNTDAEGRLVLGDCMTYVQREYDPHTVLDFATLTGAMVSALADVYTGVFANDDDLWQKLDVAGKQSQEENWRMPVLHAAFANAMKGKDADLSNTGSMAGAGASTAAAFLHEFIEDAPDGSKRAWAHMDIAGTSRKGGSVSGVGVRMTQKFVANDIEEKAKLSPPSAGIGYSMD